VCLGYFVAPSVSRKVQHQHWMQGLKHLTFTPGPCPPLAGVPRRCGHEGAAARAAVRYTVSNKAPLRQSCMALSGEACGAAGFVVRYPTRPIASMCRAVINTLVRAKLSMVGRCS
jgi:hypothetical protein